MMQEKTGRGAIHWMADFESKTRLAMIKYVSKGYSLMVNEKGGWCLLNDDSDIEWLTPRSYSEKDIKLSKFRYGSHWYAKIRNIDVVDEIGNVKWNTEEMAMQKAKEYLKTLN
jgi:hypothetical protein